jgi:CheY-like chemotaxis protein
MRKHNGCIDVESEPGKGSVFCICLPASRLKARQVDMESTESHPGSGRILVMDDEEFIRDTVSAMLSNLGYETVCAKDGNEAIAQFVRHRAAGLKIDAIILDLTIPGSTGGKEVVAAIRESDKTIPVIVASGYSEDPAIAAPMDFGFSASIAKPFTTREISKVLKSALNR